MTPDALLRNALALLAELEWASTIRGAAAQECAPQVLPACPRCGGARPTDVAALALPEWMLGHKPGCALDELLTDASLTLGNYSTVGGNT